MMSMDKFQTKKPHLLYLGREAFDRYTEFVNLWFLAWVCCKYPLK